VVVALVAVKFVEVSAPTEMLLEMIEFRLDTAALKLVVKKFVVVADVPVPFTNVKFCKVLEPFKSRLPVVKSPELLWTVLNNVVAKKFVVVADVPVALVNVNF
jgi:hypothetical protein